MNSLTWARNLDRNDSMNPILLVFFSEINYSYLEEKIVERVQAETGLIIAKPDKMATLMSMMNRYNRNKPDASHDIRMELKKLNSAFFNSQVKTLTQGLTDYKDYYKHASTIAVPLARSSQADRIKGSKVLRNKFLTNRN